MGKISRRASLAIIGAAPLAGALAVRAEEAGDGLSSSREVIRSRYFPNVTLITHEGRTVKFYDDLIKDNIVTINFMYADCGGVCPGITMNLAKVQKALGDRVGRDIFMYSFTLQPEHDTPAVLKAYAEMHGVKPGWSFLTGDPADMELLRRKLGFVDPDPEVDKDKSQHIGNVRYGNEPLQLWAACPGLANPQWIVESIGFVDWPAGRRGGR
ncbi:MAG: SCO1/SenC family protein/cytochrome c [Acidobacteria bacterium 13_1_40CM_65_14]|nr:MAG: SCO1/SenC family protein/cytochrome c [Acidobacteria bacterium 13_1_40CM_65_14]